MGRLPNLLVVLGMWGAIAALGGGSSEKPEGPFRHDRHAALKLRCNYCHTTVEKEDQASFPAIAQCRTCHTGITEDREIPSERIYRVKDFVFFSHQRHVSGGKVDCAACHGAVYTMAALRVERATTMAACVNCHKEHQASIACNVCHELGQ
jgi:hypothetical protein